MLVWWTLVFKPATGWFLLTAIEVKGWGAGHFKEQVAVSGAKWGASVIIYFRDAAKVGETTAINIFATKTLLLLSKTV